MAGNLCIEDTRVNSHSSVFKKQKDMWVKRDEVILEEIVQVLLY
jgi:uncharacterized Fe-S cluster protein YjdI